MRVASLAASQQAFLAHLLDEERAPAEGWTERHLAGLAVYRNAYRARLIDALRDTYERTARWIGDDAFQQAAAHHVISHPPTSWTLDKTGEGFAQTLCELFAGDPEVAELAWLEWAMHRCFVSADAQPMNVAELPEATASFDETDWADLHLEFLPGTCQTAIAHDLGTLWRALGQDDAGSPDYSLNASAYCVVWREGFKPVFMQVDAVEGQALALMLGGASFGQVCEALVDMLSEEEAVAQAGSILGRWIHHGMIAGVNRVADAEHGRQR